MEISQSLAFVALVGAASAGLFAIGKLVRAVWRAVHGVITMAERVASTTEIVERELRPNGGSSMKDHVRKTAERFEALEARVRVVEQHDGIEVEPGGRRATDPVVLPVSSTGAIRIDTPPR